MRFGKTARVAVTVAAIALLGGSATGCCARDSQAEQNAQIMAAADRVEGAASRAEQAANRAAAAAKSASEAAQRAESAASRAGKAFDKSQYK